MIREFRGIPLTDAAAAAIDEWLNQAREEVLKGASQAATEAYGERPPEITIRDILAAAESSAIGRTSDWRRDRLERTLRWYSFFFAAIALSGALLWIGPSVSTLESPQLASALHG